MNSLNSIDNSADYMLAIEVHVCFLRFLNFAIQRLKFTSCNLAFNSKNSIRKFQFKIFKSEFSIQRFQFEALNLKSETQSLKCKWRDRKASEFNHSKVCQKITKITKNFTQNFLLKKDFEITSKAANLHRRLSRVCRLESLPEARCQQTED